MASTTYLAFTARMIGKYEGGYGWNKKDAGGPTKYGITCYDLAEHLGQKMDSMDRWAPIVRAMTLATAEDIYKTKYAAAIRYDDLPIGIDVEMMDYGVNSGTSRSIRVASVLCGLPVRTKMDQTLLDAIKKMDVAKFIRLMSAERMKFLRGLSNWDEFGGGWTARVNDLTAYANHLIAAPGAIAEPIAPDLTQTSVPKGMHANIGIVSNTVKGAGSAAVASGVTSHLSALPIELTAIIVGFVVVAGFAYVMYQNRAVDTANATVVLAAA